MARCSLQGLSSFNGEYPVETRKTPLPDRLTATRVCFVDFLALGSYSDSLQGEGETGKPGGQGVRQWTQTNNTPRYRRVFSEKGGWIARVWNVYLDDRTVIISNFSLSLDLQYMFP